MTLGITVLFPCVLQVVPNIISDLCMICSSLSPNPLPDIRHSLIWWVMLSVVVLIRLLLTTATTTTSSCCTCCSSTQESWPLQVSSILLGGASLKKIVLRSLRIDCCMFLHPLNLILGVMKSLWRRIGVMEESWNSPPPPPPPYAAAAAA